MIGSEQRCLKNCIAPNAKPEFVHTVLLSNAETYNPKSSRTTTNPGGGKIVVQRQSPPGSRLHPKVGISKQFRRRDGPVFLWGRCFFMPIHPTSTMVENFIRKHDYTGLGGVLGRQQIKVVVDGNHRDVEIIDDRRSFEVASADLLHLPLPRHFLDSVQRFRFVVMPQQHGSLQRESKLRKKIQPTSSWKTFRKREKACLDFVPLIVDILQPREEQPSVVSWSNVLVLFLLQRNRPELSSLLKLEMKSTYEVETLAHCSPTLVHHISDNSSILTKTETQSLGTSRNLCSGPISPQNQC